jgi:hypothetical protein
MVRNASISSPRRVAVAAALILRLGHGAQRGLSQRIWRSLLPELPVPSSPSRFAMSFPAVPCSADFDDLTGLDHRALRHRKLVHYEPAQENGLLEGGYFQRGTDPGPIKPVVLARARQKSQRCRNRTSERTPQVAIHPAVVGSVGCRQLSPPQST